MKKATIYDHVRMCKTEKVCNDCPLHRTINGTNLACDDFLMNCVDRANEIVLKWCEEHPVETRQDKFLKMFPKAKLSSDGLVSICAQGCDRSWNCKLNIDANNIGNSDCTDCMKEYWLAEVEE